LVVQKIWSEILSCPCSPSTSTERQQLRRYLQTHGSKLD